MFLILFRFNFFFQEYNTWPLNFFVVNSVDTFVDVYKDVFKSVEVASKSSIGFKVKANCDGQPKEYREYFEDWTSQFNTEI